MGSVLGGLCRCIRNALDCRNRKKQMAREQFRVHGLKQRVKPEKLEKPAKDGKIGRPDRSGKQNPVIAYGAAKFAPSAKNELSGPTTSTFQRCIKHFRVVLVDEQMTSQVCHRYDQITCPVMNDGHEISGLRWCRSTNFPEQRSKCRLEHCELFVMWHTSSTRFGANSL